MAVQPESQPGGRIAGRAKTDPAEAVEIGSGDPDYARLWKLVNDKNGNRYDAYQKKTTRQIPLVALKPR